MNAKINTFMELFSYVDFIRDMCVVLFCILILRNLIFTAGGER